MLFVTLALLVVFVGIAAGCASPRMLGESDTEY